MTGDIKNLSHPKSTRDFENISRREWFKCNYMNKPKIAMLVGHAAFNNCKALLIDNNGDITVVSPRDLVNHADFLGYLTTEDSVTIHGSLDPDWVEPEPTHLPEMKDDCDIASIPFFTVFSYFDKHDSMEKKGVVLPCTSKHYGRDGKILFIIYDDGKQTYSELPNEARNRRRLLRLEPDFDINLFKKNIYANRATFP